MERSVFFGKLKVISLKTTTKSIENLGSKYIKFILLPNGITECKPLEIRGLYTTSGASWAKHRTQCNRYDLVSKLLSGINSYYKIYKKKIIMNIYFFLIFFSFLIDTSSSIHLTVFSYNNKTM